MFSSPKPISICSISTHLTSKAGRQFIPRRCSGRFLSTSAPPPPPPSAGCVHLTNRRLISLRGRDTLPFLQGLVSTTVGNGNGTYAAFLNPTGRVIADVFIYHDRGSRIYNSIFAPAISSTTTGIAKGRDEDEDTTSIFVEVDGATLDTLAKHLKRHKLRSKLDIQLPDPSAYALWSHWTDNNPQTPNPNTTTTPFLTLPDPRGGGTFGFRTLTPTNTPPPPLPPVSLSTYTIRRYLYGIAEGASEILPGESLPQDSNIDLMGGIDFRKGCYVGQELTIRTHHTGVVRKRILPLILYGLDGDGMPSQELTYNPDSTPLPPLGTNITHATKRGRTPGKFIAGIGNLGLGLCRLEIMTDVVVGASDPGLYNPEARFVVKWEDGGVGVVPIVPRWVREGVEGLRELRGR
ncbi:MAG: ccr4 associated factor [Cirrosporium novae-zelandiae]|nr:MAG: ccr4 associated factor [Cirrosporium novae-zelandiae]